MIINDRRPKEKQPQDRFKVLVYFKNPSKFPCAIFEFSLKVGPNYTQVNLPVVKEVEERLSSQQSESNITLQGQEMSKKTEKKMKEKVIEDKTFGLKNKNKSTKV